MKYGGAFRNMKILYSSLTISLAFFTLIFEIGCTKGGLVGRSQTVRKVLPTPTVYLPIATPTSISVLTIDDAPVASAITPASFNEDTQSIITLSYTDADSDLATTCSLSALSSVTITQACACDGGGVCTVGVTGTPLNYSGAASFNYTVTANSAVSNSASATLTIGNTDDAPVASAITPASFNEDTQSIITLSYTDADSDLATTCSLSALSSVTITQACACDGGGVCTVGVTGTPLNYSGAASFNYTVTANSAVSNSAAATLTIGSSDSAPVASAITPASFNEDTQSIITLSYTDADSDLATTCSLSALSSVTITQACACDGGGVCTVGVTGAPLNYNGAASFNYTVTANSAVSNSASATLTIGNTDDAPVASAITPASFNEDTQSIITLSYTDADSDLATTCSLSALSSVTITQACACDGGGVCTVGVTGTPLNYSGAASFNYTVTANSAVSNSAAATLTINNIDDAPVANAITPASFNEDTQSIISLNYTDADSDLATACSLSALSSVTITQACACDGGGVCTVGVTGTPLNYSGAASFNYAVTANSAVSNSASATLTINSTDDAPVANSIIPTNLDEDIQSIITLSYTDVEGDLATACALANLENVTISSACACVAGSCSVGVTGVSNYHGAAGFDYTVTANGLLSNSAAATLTINSTDDAPVASAITPASFNEDTQSIITLSYTDADSDLATTCILSALSSVTITQACACDGGGVCTVGVTGTPLNYSGAASFNYTVTANSAVSNSAAATLTINNIDDAPVANAITPASFNEDTQSIISLNYTDADSDLATTCSLSALSSVTITQACACDGGGVCTVGVTGTPLNYNGAASFNYTVTANSAVSNSAAATLTINNTDDAPVANSIIPANLDEDIQSIITLSYTDVEGDLATACALANLDNVTISAACVCVAGSCSVGVTGVSNYHGAAGFDYTVTANGVLSNSAPATLTINSTDDAPVASAITPASFNEDTQSIITLSYTDADSDLATTCSLSALSSVTITQACACDGGGVCTVGVTGTPLNYNGAASFNYTVTANSAVSNSASATLTINNTDNAPVASAITPASFNEDTQSIITLSYTDADSDLATTCSLSALSSVTITQACACDGGGVCTVGVTGTPLNYSGAASFNYTVTANSAVSNSASATLTINNTDNAPVASAITPASFNEDTQSIITLSYTDADSDLATTCSLSALSSVTITQACACDGGGVCTVGVTGTPLNYSGAASFNYTVTANSAVSNSAAATLTINSTDDAPVASAITPASFNVDTQSIITLSYTDADSDLATACSLSALSSVTITQACACDGGGVCTVGVTGTPLNYSGAASFNYTVTANSVVSNSASATFSIYEPGDVLNLVAISSGTGSISLSWTNEGPAIGFVVSYLVGTTAPADCQSGTEDIDVYNVTSYVVNNLQKGTTYSFRVCLYNDDPPTEYSYGATASTTTRTVTLELPGVCTAGYVNTTLLDDANGILYFGGSFLAAGPCNGGGHIFDTNDLSGKDFTDLSLKVSGTVSSSISDGSGGFYVGGDFTAIGGVAKKGLAHILADETIVDWMPKINGNVKSMALAGQILYIGGDFSSVGDQMSSSGSVFDTSSGDINKIFGEVNGVVNVSISDGSGGFYVGGAFTSIGGVLRNRIAHINSEGTITAFDPNADSSVAAMALSGTTLYVGGSFSTIGGQSRNYLAAIDTTTGLATAFDSNPSSDVTSLALSGLVLYVGGSFSSIGGQSRNYLAAIDTTTGLATTFNPNPSGPVYAMIPGGSVLYVGGSFITIGGQTRSRIAALDISTGLATTFNPNASSTVNALALSGTTLYAGGAFTTVGGQSRNRIAALDTSTGLATTFDPNASSTILALALSGSTLYAGGSFITIGGQSRNRIAALDVSTGLATTFNPNAVNNSVYALALSGSMIYIGGNYTTIGGQTRNRIAAIDTSTGLATEFNPDAGGSSTVSALVLSGQTLYVGGTFTTIGGLVRNRIAAIDTSTGVATSFDPNAGSTVSVLVLSGQTLYVGGAFTTIGGQTRNRIAGIDITTGLATAFDPNSSGWVFAMVLSDQTLYVGGNFSTIGGQPRNSVAAIDTTTGLVTTFDPNSNAIVYSLAFHDEVLYVGGTFTTLGGQARNRAASVNTTTGIITDFNPNAAATVFVFALSGEKLYLGGNFTAIGGRMRNRIAALDTTTGIITDFDPNAGATVNSMALSGSTLYAGGGFITMGGQTRNRIAAIDTSTGMVTAFNPNASSTVSTMVISDSTLYAGGAFTFIGGQARNYLAAIDTSTGLATTFNPNASASVSVMVLSDTTLYVGGTFTSVGGKARNRIAALDTITGTATNDFNPNSDASVDALALSGTTLYAGGTFTTIGGQTRNKIAALDISTGLATALDLNAGSTVSALALSGTTLYVGGSFTTIGGEERVRIAAIDTASGLVTAFNPVINNVVYTLAPSDTTLYVGGTFTTVDAESQSYFAGIDISE